MMAGRLMMMADCSADADAYSCYVIKYTRNFISSRRQVEVYFCCWYNSTKQGFFCKVPLCVVSSCFVLFMVSHPKHKRHISTRKICRSNALVKSAISNWVINRRKFIFLVRFAFRVRYACVIRVSKISKDAKKCFISKCFVFLGGSEATS